MRTTNTTTLGLLGVLANILPGCTGNIEDSASFQGDVGEDHPGQREGGSRPDGPGLPENQGACRPTSEQPLTAARLRRLSVDELYASLGQAFGIALQADVSAFPQDPSFGGYLVKNSVTLSQDFVDALDRKILDITDAVMDAKVFPTTCIATLDPGGCIQRGLANLLERLFRGPVTAEEVDRALYVYTSSAAGKDAASGVRTLMQYLMLHPRFLYHSEVGTPTDDPGVRRLTAFELASQLSYAIQGHGPDDELFALAASGTLSNRDTLVAEARRLLATDSGKRRTQAFFHQWLQLSHPTALQPVFGDLPATELVKEADHFFDNALTNNLSVPDLMSTRQRFLSPRLKAHYDLTDDQLADEDHPRRGVLTLGAFLASHGKNSPLNPIFRGVFISDRIFCRGLPPPPQDVALAEDALDGEPKTPREILAMHRSEGAGCDSCHKFIDPLGFALEEFDHLGRHRTTYDDGMPVDASGTLEDTDVDGVFSNYSEFVDLLAKSRQVERCFVSNYASFALAELIDNIDSCASKTVHAQVGDGVRIADFIAGFVSSDWFRHRSQPRLGD